MNGCCCGSSVSHCDADLVDTLRDVSRNEKVRDRASLVLVGNHAVIIESRSQCAR